MEINGFTHSELISSLKFAVEVAGDGGINPWRDGEYEALMEFLDYLKGKNLD